MEERPLSELLGTAHAHAAQGKDWPQQAASLIVEVRTATGMSQSDLARAAGVSRSYINRIEHGHQSVSPGTFAGLVSVMEGSTSGSGTQGSTSLSINAKADAAQARRK